MDKHTRNIIITLSAFLGSFAFMLLGNVVFTSSDIFFSGFYTAIPMIAYLLDYALIFTTFWYLFKEIVFYEKNKSAEVPETSNVS